MTTPAAIASRQERLARIAALIKSHQDFPKVGINFRDIFPLLRDPAALSDCVELLCDQARQSGVTLDAVVGLDARGFLFGVLVAQRLGVAFVPVRKAGKLPGATARAMFTLEYGTAELEVQKESLTAGQTVIIVDDLLATGGTLAAACKVLKELKVKIHECIVVIELAELKGREKVSTPIFSLLTF